MESSLDFWRREDEGGRAVEGDRNVSSPSFYPLKNEWSQKDSSHPSQVSRSRACLAAFGNTVLFPSLSFARAFALSQSVRSAIGCKRSPNFSRYAIKIIIEHVARNASRRVHLRSSCRNTPCHISCSDIYQSTHTQSTTSEAVHLAVARSQ